MKLCGSVILASLLHSANVAVGNVSRMEKQRILCTDCSTVLNWIISDAILTVHT